MKIKKTDINLLIMLLGVLIAVAAYFLVFTAYNDKTAALESDNAVLQEEVDGLQELADHKQEYIDETARMNTEITDTMARFLAGVLPEDILMYAYTLENTQSVYFESIAMDNASLVTVATDNAATGDAVESTEVTEETGDTVVASAGMQDTVFLYSTPVTYGFKTTNARAFVVDGIPLAARETGNDHVIGDEGRADRAPARNGMGHLCIRI